MKRRNFLKGLGVVTAASMTVTPAMLHAEEKKQAPKSPNQMDYKTAVDTITGGKGTTESDTVKLTVPEIAENGAVVPVKVHVDHPMDEGNYVKAIHVLAKENSNVRCADAMLTPLNGAAYFATRIKLAKTQEVVAVVALSNGTFLHAAKSVKVTIGGCG